MKSQTKSATVRRYKVSYSWLIFKLEILIVLMAFAGQFLAADEIQLLPSLLLSATICFIYFSTSSIITQFPKGLVFEFREAPDRLICYDKTGESCYLIQDLNIMMTRWFVLLQFKNETGRHSRVFLYDSFIDMNDYTSFRRNLLLKKDMIQHAS